MEREERMTAVEIKKKICELRDNRLEMDFEEYTRQYSLLCYKLECAKAREAGRWEQGTQQTYHLEIDRSYNKNY